MTRRPRPLAALLLGLVVLSGCSDDPGPTPDPEREVEPTVSVEGAPQAYGSLVTSVVDAVFGEETSWDDVRSATEQALEPRGFALTEQLDIPGGYNGFDAEADDGAVLEVRSKLGNPSTISLDAPVTGDCDRG